MAFSVKQWFNPFGASVIFGSDPDLDQAVDTGDVPQTPVDAAGLRDMETRLSDYTDAQRDRGGVLLWDGNAYVPAPDAREFRGPVDPSTVEGITLGAGDVWTPTEEPVQ